MLRSRISWLARPTGEFAVGAVCVLMVTVLVLPVPPGNVLLS